MSYLDTIIAKSDDTLKETITAAERIALIDGIDRNLNTGDTIAQFNQDYLNLIKRKYQATSPHNQPLQSFIEHSGDKPKIIWGDCRTALDGMKAESIHLMVTSPPYYNAREYSTWDNLNDYLTDMEHVIKSSYRVLDNHRAFIFNVGDITGNDNITTKALWGSRRIPLGAYFINIFERQGFTFIDDFIWDKGEVQSNRMHNGDNPTPLYQYPMNAYEHIMVFIKHRLDDTKYPCPCCGCLKLIGNAHTRAGIRSWECSNKDCFKEGKGKRGKRFSLRSKMMDGLSGNVIDGELIKRWRKDIVKIQPVVKINNKGENTLGHTAPFPSEIPEYAIEAFSGKGETVLDMFMGSGTTVIEAVNRGRRGIGIELNKGLFETSIRTNMQRNGYSVIDEISV